MLGSAGSIVPKRWILGIFALGLIAVMVATSASPWAGAATLPTSVTASAVSVTEIQVSWTAVDGGSTVPAGGTVDSYNISCAPTSGSPIATTASGIAANTVTVTGLTASTAYICSVSAVATGSTPGSSISAASVTTPANLSKLLGSVVITPVNPPVQESGGSVVLSAAVKGADSSKTAIMDLTVNWSITSGAGFISSSTGASINFMSAGDGNTVVQASVTQSSSGITKTDSTTIDVFVVAPGPAPELLVPITAAEEAVLNESITEIFDALGISESDSNVAGDVVSATKEAVVSISNADTVDTGDSESADLHIPAGATGSAGVAVTAVQEEFDPATKDEPTADQGLRISTSTVTIELRDKDGNKFANALTSDATITLSIPLSVTQAINVDTQSLTLYKSKDGKAPWTKLISTVTIVDGVVKVTGKTRNFSVFIIVSEPREIGIPGTAAVAAAILPSAGDTAPTTTQALLLTGLGLLLIVGGGVYVRRQRRASGTV